MKQLIILLCISILFFSACRDDFGEVNLLESDYTYSKGFFVVNEGLYGQGNASVSFVSLNSMQIQNNIFYSENNRPLGDVATSMLLIDDALYIVVNNSGKIEVVDLDDFNSSNTITGFQMPSNILQIDPQTAYVSDLNYHGIHIVDIASGQITQQIITGKSTHKLLQYQNYCFTTNWSSFYINKNNNTVQVIDITQKQLVDSIVVGKEPNSMQIDKNNKIWVLCSGGYLSEEFPRLICFNPINLQIEKDIIFPSKTMSPTSLCINANADSLYYINTDIYAMSINDTSLNTQVLVPANGSVFYSLEVANNKVFITDAIDYQQNGNVLIYSTSGQFFQSLKAGIIPSGFCFVE
jgi:Domain of unknown function (DUF5074)